MASSIPSMPASNSTTNNRPLSLSSSSSSAPMNLFNNNLSPEKSQSLNFTTKTTADKIKNAHHLQQLQLQAQAHFQHQQHQQYRHPHEDQSNPINFSAAAKLFTPFANSPLFSHHQHSIAAAGLAYNSLAAAGPPNLRRDRRLRKSSAGLRSMRKPSNDIDHNSVNMFGGGYQERFMNRIGTVGPPFKEHERQFFDSEIPIERQLNSSPPSKEDEPMPKYEHLKWDDHVTTTVSAIQSLLHNETFCDVTLICDTEESCGGESLVGETGEEDHQFLVENETKERNNNKVDKISRSRCNSDVGNCNDDLSPIGHAIEGSKRRNSAETNETGDNEATESQIKPSRNSKSDSHPKFKAHKLILSTCSEYFCRMFSENPCKHPVIVLKDFQPWEVQALLDFMYKGQVILKPEHLETLVKAAEALQIRGLKEVIEKSQEWKQRKVTSPAVEQKQPGKSSEISDDDDGEHQMECETNEEEKPVETATESNIADEYSDDGDGESRASKCRRQQQRRASNDLSKHTRRKSQRLGNHEMKRILKYDDEYEDDDDGFEDNSDGEDGFLSPKLLNLSMGTTTSGGSIFAPYNTAHQDGLLLRSSLSTRRLPAAAAATRHSNSGEESEDRSPAATTANEPQTAVEAAAGDSFPRNIHNHHGQTNPSASPPFPRRKQARPRRRSGDFVAQDLRTTPLSGIEGNSPYQQHLFPQAHDDSVDPQQQHDANNEVLDFTIGNNNNNNSGGAKRDTANANERLLTLPHSSQVNNFIANHFLKTWSSSTSGGGSRTDSPTVQSPHPHHQLLTTAVTSSPMKRELDSEDPLLSPPVDNYHSRPGTPDTASPPLSEVHKPVLRRRRDRFAHRRRHHNNQHGFNGPTDDTHLGQFGNNIPSPTNYFHAMNNGHPQLPPHHHPHLGSGHNSDPETSTTPSSSTPPKSYSPSGFPFSLSSGSANLHQNPGPGGPWPGLPLGPPPIFGRHRAQHSAPRGGPPRAWSNADLTEALHNVWNKKMTTSQASRIFGIPYNSLLMYVRGKYGKSLKLDVLKKGLDMAMLEKAKNGSNSSPGTTSSGNRSSTPNNNNNNNQSNKSKSHSAVDSPPLSLNINSLMGGDREQQQQSNREHNNINSATEGSVSHSSSNNNNSRNDPQDIIPSGFNPFSIFGEYPPPFPFSNAAAAAAALSHMLPPPPNAAAANHLGIGGGVGDRNEKGNKSHSSSARHHHGHHHHRSNSGNSGDTDK